jgi:hypothetical protein
VYGAVNPVFDFTYSGFVNLETSADLNSKPVATTPATVLSGVNTYTITPSGASSSNYSITYVNGTLSVTPAPLVITVNNASRTYGSANPAFFYSYSGFVNGDNASAFQLAFNNPTTTATTVSGVGTYTITPNGGNVGPNYTPAGGLVNPGTLTITQAQLTVTANNKSRAYGVADPIFDYSFSGFVNGENSGVLTTNPFISTTSNSFSGVGQYTIIPSGGSATNYTLNYVNGTLTITSASLTVTANDKSKIYGAANPTFDFNYVGFVNGETATVLNSLPTASTLATSASGVNSYAIVPTGGSSNNYTLSYVNGTLTVTPAPIAVTVNAASRTYGASNPTFSYSYSGFVNGDDASAFQLPFSTPTTTAIPGSPVGNYTITAAGGNVGPNYSTSVSGGSVNAGILTITKVSLTVSINDQTKVYGAPNPNFTFSYSGFVNGDNTSAIISAPAVSSTATILTGVGTYPIVSSGGSATNYAFSSSNGTLTITRAPMTVIANDATRVFGVSNPNFGFSYTGFVNGDDASVIKIQPTATTAATTQSNVGQYSITPAGGSADNYSFVTYQPGALTITKADQTITFAPLIPVSPNSPPVTLTAVASSGLPVSYTSSNSTIATLNGSTLTIVGTGSIDITASQAGDNNYNAAVSVTQTQFIKVSQMISFSAIPAKLVNDAPFDLSAASSSGLPVTFTSSDTTTAKISGTRVTIVAAGSVDITAHQSGDATYFTANDVKQTLVINKLDQAITFSQLDIHLLGDAPFALTATASSNLPVTYSSSNTSVATVSNNVVTILGVGNTTITASQSGDKIFTQAADATQELTIKLITGIEPSIDLVRSVYPNPTTGLIHLTLQNETEQGQVKLFDLKGTEIITDKPAATTDQFHFTLDISNLNPGMYLLYSGSTQIKIIKN